MAGLSRLRLFYLLHLSKPASDRLVYREIRRLKARKVVELGLGTGQRAVHIIEVLKEFHEVRDIHYTGVDLFEARTAADGPGISLREAHCLLKATERGSNSFPVPWAKPFRGSPTAYRRSMFW